MCNVAVSVAPRLPTAAYWGGEPWARPTLHSQEGPWGRSACSQRRRRPTKLCQRGPFLPYQLPYPLPGHRFVDPADAQQLAVADYKWLHANLNHEHERERIARQNAEQRRRLAAARSRTDDDVTDDRDGAVGQARTQRELMA